MIGWLKSLFGAKPQPRMEGRTLVRAGGTGRGRRTVGIFYLDAKGDESERVITIERMSLGNSYTPSRIWAHCHLRGETREFRIDRIQGFFDPETGEMIEEVELWDGRSEG